MLRNFSPHGRKKLAKVLHQILVIHLPHLLASFIAKRRGTSNGQLQTLVLYPLSISYLFPLPILPIFLCFKYLNPIRMRCSGVCSTLRTLGIIYRQNALSLAKYRRILLVLTVGALASASLERRPKRKLSGRLWGRVMKTVSSGSYCVLH